MIKKTIFIVSVFFFTNLLYAQNIKIINKYTFREVNNLLKSSISSDVLSDWKKIVNDYNFRITNISKSKYNIDISSIKNTTSLSLQGRYFNCRMNAFLLVKKDILEYDFKIEQIEPLVEVELNNYRKYGIELNKKQKYIYGILFSTIYLSNTSNSNEILEQKYEKLKMKKSLSNILIVNQVYPNAIAVTHAALIISNGDDTVSIVEKLSPFDPFIVVNIKKSDLYNYYKDILSTTGHLVITIGNEILKNKENSTL